MVERVQVDVSPELEAVYPAGRKPSQSWLRVELRAHWREANMVPSDHAERAQAEFRL